MDSDPTLQKIESRSDPPENPDPTELKKSATLVGIWSSSYSFGYVEFQSVPYQALLKIMNCGTVYIMLLILDGSSEYLTRVCVVHCLEQ